MKLLRKSVAMMPVSLILMQGAVTAYAEAVDTNAEQGDCYVNTSDKINITLGKIYQNGAMPVSIGKSGTGFAFYPRTAEGVTVADLILFSNKNKLLLEKHRWCAALFSGFAAEKTPHA